eukprot:scaffold45359_cov60-Phaeocystis_antarctica.AAC.6
MVGSEPLATAFMRVVVPCGVAELTLAPAVTSASTAASEPLRAASISAWVGKGERHRRRWHRRPEGGTKRCHWEPAESARGGQGGWGAPLECEAQPGARRVRPRRPGQRAVAPPRRRLVVPAISAVMPPV